MSFVVFPSERMVSFLVHGLCLLTILVNRACFRILIPAGQWKRESTCWFAEHATINLIVSVFTWPYVLMMLDDPLHCFTPVAHVHGVPSWASMTLVLWLHLYHTVCYSLTWDDMFHHGLFALLLAGTGGYYEWGYISNAQLFFICGLPGGIIYGILALRRCLRSSLNEPLVSALVNVFVRCPGILTCTYSFLMALRHGQAPSAPSWAIVVQLLLSPINGIYYGVESVRRMNRLRRQKDS